MFNCITSNFETILSSVTTLLTAFIATKAYKISKSTFEYNKELNNIKYKPQLYIKRCNQQYTDYVGIDMIEENHITKYEGPKLKLNNISETIIYDINISLSFKNEENGRKLLHYAINEPDGNIMKDIYGISWDNVLGLENHSEENHDILDGNSEIEISLPSLFVAYLKGYHFMRRKGELLTDIFMVPLILKITYKHTYTNTPIIIEKEINIKFDGTNKILQGPIVKIDSIIFEKL
ncbi:hypothetical protein IDG46_25390 [Staphylococcus sp. EG-SA-13]|nr:hypothetical protein [Staphylococcus sp. EG-SA-13]